MKQKNTVMILLKKKEVQVEIEILKVIFSIFEYFLKKRVDFFQIFFLSFNSTTLSCRNNKILFFRLVQKVR